MTVNNIYFGSTSLWVPTNVSSSRTADLEYRSYLQIKAEALHSLIYTKSSTLRLMSCKDAAPISFSCCVSGTNHALVLLWKRNNQFFFFFFFLEVASVQNNKQSGVTRIKTTNGSFSRKTNSVLLFGRWKDSKTKWYWPTDRISVSPLLKKTKGILVMFWICQALKSFVPVYMILGSNVKYTYDRNCYQMCGTLLKRKYTHRCRIGL